MSQHSVTVEDGELKAVLLNRTIRTEMCKTAILSKMSFYGEIADEHGFDVNSVDVTLTTFARIGAHIDHENSVLDFDPPHPKDTVDEVKTKFVAWLDYANMKFYDSLQSAISRIYRPPVEPKKKANEDEPENE